MPINKTDLGEFIELLEDEGWVWVGSDRTGRDMVYNLEGAEGKKYSTGQDKPWAQAAFNRSSKKVSIHYHPRKLGNKQTFEQSFTFEQLQEALKAAAKVKARCDTCEDPL
jgi:hypothetical protein